MIIQKVGNFTWRKTSIKNLVAFNMFGFEFKLNMITSYAVVPQIKAVEKQSTSFSLQTRRI